MSSRLKAFQARLMEMGFPLPTYGADGDFGNETATAAAKALDELQRLRGHAPAAVVSPGAPQPAARLDAAAFKRWAPKAVAGTYEAIEAALAGSPVLAEPLVTAHWLGQMWVESAGFSVLTESLNYSVDGLLKTFGRHRITAAQARAHGRRPGHAADQEAIANIVYGGEWGRKNLGNTQLGDGWRFRGSGVKQITGRANTERSGFTPEELRTDIFKSVEAAADFFLGHGCAAPARRDDVDGVTRIVNGGTNGLDLRRQKTAEAKGLVLRR